MPNYDLTPFFTAGTPVLNPNGSKLCEFAKDVYPSDYIQIDQFGNWTDLEPKVYDPIHPSIIRLINSAYPEPIYVELESTNTPSSESTPSFLSSLKKIFNFF